MKMSTVWKRGTCFHLLPFCLPFWAALKWRCHLERGRQTLVARWPLAWTCWTLLRHWELGYPQIYGGTPQIVIIWDLNGTPLIQQPWGFYSSGVDIIHKENSWKLSAPHCNLVFPELNYAGQCPRPRMIGGRKSLVREAPCKPTAESMKCKEHRPNITHSAPSSYLDECFCGRSQTLQLTTSVQTWNLVSCNSLVHKEQSHAPVPCTRAMLPIFSQCVFNE